MENWIHKTKNELIKTETENINSRLLQWQHIVNECTKNEYIAAFKSESRDFINLPPYTPSTNDSINESLRLVLNWKGLSSRMRAGNKLPSTLKDYKHKAKNQINGSRAKHYSRTLYPFMIDCAEHYANNISNLLFSCNTYTVSSVNAETCAQSSDYRNMQQQCLSLFYDILMYSYLVQLCQCRLRVTKQGRRVNLLCDNSIISHKSNITTKMFQKYAGNHAYIDQFPSHREEAIGYFNAEKKKAYQQLFILYQKRKTFEILNEKKLMGDDVDVNVLNVVRYGGNMMDVMQFIGQNCTSDDGKRVNIEKETFNVLMESVNTLEEKSNENIEVCNSLRQHCVGLETDIQRILIQSKHDDNDKINEPEQDQEQSQSGIGKDYFSVNNNVYGYAPTAYNEDINFNDDVPAVRPEMTHCMESSFGCNCTTYSFGCNCNNYCSQDINNAFECDGFVMNSAPMSVDNNLVNPTDTIHTNDEYIHTHCNFNEKPFNYNAMDCSSIYNII